MTRAVRSVVERQLICTSGRIVSRLGYPDFGIGARLRAKHLVISPCSLRSQCFSPHQNVNSARGNSPNSRNHSSRKLSNFLRAVTIMVPFQIANQRRPTRVREMSRGGERERERERKRERGSNLSAREALLTRMYSKTQICKLWSLV